MAEYSHAELCLGEPWVSLRHTWKCSEKPGQPGPTILIAGRFIRR